jgi:hypothetical protein
MGHMSDKMIEIQQENHARKLAKYLGISYDDFSELLYDIDTEESTDGLVYNYILSFDANNDHRILSKISNLDDNNQVWIEASTFENL